MKKWVKGAVCAAVALAPVATAWAEAPMTIASAVMPKQEQRSVRVLLAQSEIKSNINASNLGIAMGGGMLGGLIAAAQNSAREKKAEELITPLRTSLLDFDADAAASEATKSGLATVDWLSATPVTFGKDSSPTGKSAFLDQNATDQVFFIEYTYDLSPDFDALRIVATLQAANRAVPQSSGGKPRKPEDRVAYKYLAYNQPITIAVLLPNPDKDKVVNAAKWNANNGQLAHQALTQAFARVSRLIPRTLALSEADVKAMKDKSHPKQAFEGLKGSVVERQNGGTLIWAGQFVSVEPLAGAST